MKKTLLIVCLLVSNFAYSAPARGVKEVSNRAEAREFLGLTAGTEGVLAEGSKAVKALRKALEDVSKDTTKFVEVSRLDAQAKTQVSTAITSMANETSIRITNLDGLSEAIAKRSDLLLTVTMLISKERTDLLEVIASNSDRSSAELAAIGKLIELSSTGEAKLKKIASDVLTALKAGSKEGILSLLKKNGYKSQLLEDFIIC